MTLPDWMKDFPAAITICDNDGRIIYMNDKSSNVFEKQGGAGLVGKNLFDCHSPASVEKLKEMISGTKTNVYTIEKNGIKKLIYQSPWYSEGKPMGLVELSIEIPFEMEHHIRG